MDSSRASIDKQQHIPDMGSSDSLRSHMREPLADPY
jgi:hypothetical protein